jgi:hypothetical protein
MSEPLAAFAKFRIDRARLLRWLSEPVAPASKWSDWRQIGGKYYFTGGVRDIADIAAAELADKVSEADGELGSFATYRSALRSVLDSAEAPYMKRAQYLPEMGELVVGSLAYSENLTAYISFYAIMRGVEAVLGPDDYGIAVIHNYFWGSASDRVPHSAMPMGPGAASTFLRQGDVTSAGGIIEAIAQEMVPPGASQPPVPIDELDRLK